MAHHPSRLRRAVTPCVLLVLLASPALVKLALELPFGPGASPAAAEDVSATMPATGADPEAPPEQLVAEAWEDEALGPPPEDDFRCEMPAVAIDRTAGCDAGLPYPACKWRIPDPDRAENLYAIWRNTTDDHRSGRPGLVSVIVAAAAEYARHYPGEILAVGDLDAPGPHHATHEDGVDVDLYLPGMMIAENPGSGEYPSNYDRLDELGRRMVRGRVETLARILATCTDGAVRIYYNDWRVERRFEQWFDAHGYESPFGSPMQEHNDLHRFHFHVTVPHDLPALEPTP